MPRRRDQTGDPARPRRRLVRARGDVGDPAGRVVQDHGPAHLQDVAIASPFRACRLEGNESRRPLLDHRDHLRDDLAGDAEIAMSRTLVIGAGKSGVASANFLAGRGTSVVLADANANPSLPFTLDDRVVRAFGTEDDALLDDVGLIVISPGVPMTIPLLQRANALAIPVIGEIELAFRYMKGTIIAITGSNGKSTTTALIGEILKVAGRRPIVAGNIGNPLIAAIDLDHPRTYVLELSSFQLEAVESFHANVALLLNITPDHMDRYPNFAAYAAAKHRIFRNQDAGDTAILNASVSDGRWQMADGGVDATPSAICHPPSAARVLRFSASEKADAFLDGDEMVLGDRRIPRASLKLQGNANVENALAAWLAARAAGVDDVDVQIAFGPLTGVPHRMVLVRELDGVRWINDSKGTNVDATLKSLESYGPSTVWLILGGKDKAGGLERMG